MSSADRDVVILMEKGSESSDKPIHHESVQKAVERLNTDLENGLTSAQVEERRKAFGLNEIPVRPKPSVLRELLRSFTDLFSMMLQLAAVLCFVAYALDPRDIANLYLGIFLYVIVIITCFFSFVQKYRSDETLREFATYLPPKATVVRDGGCVQIVDAVELVRGDVVRLKLGDKIPADLRLTRVSGFRVDKAALTGEGKHVSLSASADKGEKNEANNLAFFGTLAVAGTAEGIVISTGANTVFGRIVKMTVDSGDEGSTTLQAEMHHFIVVTAMFSLAVGVVFFCAGVLNRTRLIHNLVYSIGMFVSNIPEGLIATVTVALTASARRMANRNVLIKRLDAIESLGSSTVICSDKTGTLTRNCMHVSSIFYDGRQEIIDELWSPPSIESKGNENWNILKYCAAVCSSAVFDDTDRREHPNKPTHELLVCGDASESGILRFVERAINVEDGPYEGAEEMRKKCKQVVTIPFNSSQKYMVTINQKSEKNDSLVVVMKGAPERVLDRCIDMLKEDGGREELTAERKERINAIVNNFANTGERVLAYAKMELTPGQSAGLLQSARNGEIPAENIPAKDLTFVGLVSLKDPPRDGVDLAVEKVRNAGLRVIMVTGDHPGTAVSIAKQVGILTLETDTFEIVGKEYEDEESEKTKYVQRRTKPEPIRKSVVITGSQILKFGAYDWQRLLSYEEIVFARTSPEHKLEIVQNLQRRNEIVAVTGDGVNDAPALKQAETGISMGLSGTEVSKEASDIVLLDDNFASIVNGVEEGRLVFDNLKKSIAYSLTSNVPQLVPFLSFVLFHIPVPLTTILVLSIDLGTDIFPAIALAYEKPESDLMTRPPRNIKREKLLNSRLLMYAMLQLGLLQTIGGFASYFLAMSDNGLTPMSLIGLDRKGRFSGAKPEDQRWLYSVHGSTQIKSNADWFASDNPRFQAYFKASAVGTAAAKNETFSHIQQPPIGLTPVNSSFNSMIKLVGRATGVPPCQRYSCMIGGALVQNNRSCFDPAQNRGPVQLDAKVNRLATDNLANGPCFSLWTPRDTSRVLKYSQTAFFSAIVVAQAFTVFACKTRVLSLASHGIDNLWIIGSVFVEFLIALVIIYTPGLRTGFQVRPLLWWHWMPAIPFGKFILMYDEVRKWLIRRDLHPVPTVNEHGNVVPRNGPLEKLARWVRVNTLW